MVDLGCSTGFVDSGLRLTMRDVQEAESKRHFDEVASTWVDRYETTASFRTRLGVIAETAGRYLGPVEDARILDVGSGPGVLAAAISERASTVVCIDTSWEMLRCGQLAPERIESVLHRAGVGHRRGILLRVAGSTAAVAGAVRKPFDLALAVSVLEYQDDPAALLVGITQLLRSSGLLLFTVPNGRSVVRRIERPVDALAVRVGRALCVDRLIYRSYSSQRPFGSSVPWVDSLTSAGAVCREIIPIPLGEGGVRARLYANLLVVAQMP